MAINKDKYIKKYIEESLENISLTENLFFKIQDEESLSSVLRALHTIKGTSRMLEFKNMEELTHSLESVFISYRDKNVIFGEKAAKLILSSFDKLKQIISNIEKTKNDNIDIKYYIDNLALTAANEESKIILNNQDEIIDNKKQESIRVPLDKIDKIIKNICACQSIEMNAKNLYKQYLNLNNDLKEFIKIFKNKYDTDIQLLSNLRKLDRTMERINSSFKDYTIDTDNSIKLSYNSVITLRTLPLSVIFDNYPRFVYEYSKETGKKIKLSIYNNNNEIDKNIIESLDEILMHIIRNCIDHGIETPEERAASQKEEAGNLIIKCSRESGHMKIVISDDGRGIDYEKIRLKAVKLGIFSQTEEPSKEELTNLIFQSGFSTSDNLSNISGRGIGMEIVRKNIESLKGSIYLESNKNEGTAFTITVPLSIEVITGFTVFLGSSEFIIPTAFVETILLKNTDEIITENDCAMVSYNDRLIKLYFLSHILKINNENDANSDSVFIIIVRSYDDTAAIAVDNIDSMKYFILKPLPKVMAKNSIFSGIVSTINYRMISVLHIPAVLKTAKNINPADLEKRNTLLVKERKTLLVVDDSKPTRDIEKDILSSAGYLVDTAADGALALEEMKSRQYDLVLTDLNMPVMNGFDLIENIKNDENLQNIPVIVISSIDNEEEKERAFKIGASHYIVKSSFNNHNMLDAVKELIGEKNG